MTIYNFQRKEWRCSITCGGGCYKECKWNTYKIWYVVNLQMWSPFFYQRVEHPSSGRFLEMFSTEPGVQFYTSFYLNETGKGGAKYEKFGAFCLEAQHYPDSPNKVSFQIEFINSVIIFPPNNQVYHNLFSNLSFSF